MDATFTFLGTGTSTGVPMIGCQCATCRSDDPRNQRTRASVLLSLPAGRLLIDTPPELRLQLIRERIPFAHAILFTHYHADHLFGLDDIRLFPHRLGHPVPVYCNEETEEVIRRTFAYAFVTGAESAPAGYVPQVQFHRIDDRPFEVLGRRVQPVPLEHAHFHVYGFRIGKLAYCTDVSRIPERSWPLLAGLDVLILGALRRKPHKAHFSLEEALEAIDRLRPKQAYLTHLSHDLEYEEISRTLPGNVQLAYDGLSFGFSSVGDTGDQA